MRKAVHHDRELALSRNRPNLRAEAAAARTLLRGAEDVEALAIALRRDLDLRLSAMRVREALARFEVPWRDLRREVA